MSRPSRRSLVAVALPTTATLVATLALTTGVTPAVGASREAPGGPGGKSTWTEADKTGFGTARERESNVWFTLQDGRASEVFYPDVATPSTRSLEVVVTDGRTFTDRETTDMVQRTSRPEAGSLRFRQVNTADSGKYQVTKEYVTDPRRDAVVVRVRLESLDGGRYQAFAVLDPALDNTGDDDRARSRGRTLVARDTGTGRSVASALVAEPAFASTANGYAGRNDGWTDLSGDHDLDRHFRAAGPGNVVQTARLGGVNGLGDRQRTTLSLGFGETGRQAIRVARSARAAGFADSRRRYDAGWARYLHQVKEPPSSAAGQRREYLASLLVLAAAEDKLNPGAIVASPSAPWVWGDEIEDLSSPSGAYHLVWSRDTYQFGSALWAAGDEAAARRMVDWLFEVQQKPDGSFPQNSDLEGEPVWSELQLDEVALPIVLAGLVDREGPRTYAGVKKAANFLLEFRDEETGLAAPYSPQERWENQSGYSPNSIAAQVAGLVVAADIARSNGDDASAERWLEAADSWQAQVKDWTVTSTGPLAETRYFLRLSKEGDPDAGTEYSIGDSGDSDVDQRGVVDPSFLDLVRYGILPPDDPDVLSTLPVIDDELSFNTSHGRFWHRFSGDGYGETRTGGQWFIGEPDTFETLGRGWPLLTGERGEYDVAAGRDATDRLAAMAAAAGSSDMLAEQVWDGRPPTGDPCCARGTNTRAATPLVWSHAGLVRLAWSMQHGVPADQQAVVAERYAGSPSERRN